MEKPHEAAALIFLAGRVPRDDRVMTVNRERLGGSYLAVLGFCPLILADVGVNLVAPPLCALLAGAAGHLGGDGGPAVAVLGLRARMVEKSNTCQKTLCDCSIAGRKGSYLKSRELDVFGVGPRRALEVQIGHLGFHVCVGEGYRESGARRRMAKRPATGD